MYINLQVNMFHLIRFEHHANFLHVICVISKQNHVFQFKVGHSFENNIHFFLFSFNIDVCELFYIDIQLCENNNRKKSTFFT